MPPAHFDLLIRSGTCVLPWGVEADRYRRARRPDRRARRRRRRHRGRDDRRRRAARPARPDRPARPSARPRRRGRREHPDRHPGRGARRPDRGVRHAEHQPRRSPTPSGSPGSRVTPSRTPGATSASMSARTKTNIAALAGARTRARRLRHQGVRRQLHRRPDGRGRRAPGARDARRAAAASPITARTSTGCRRASRCSSRAIPYARHMEWRDEECAFLGTRRLMALARKTGRPAHILHVSTAEELDYLKDFRDIATVEVLVNHLTQVAPDVYDRLGRLRRDEPADPRPAALRRRLGGDARRHGGHGRLRPRAASARGKERALAGLRRPG